MKVICKECEKEIELNEFSMYTTLEFHKKEMLTCTYVNCLECKEKYFVQVDNQQTQKIIDQMSWQAKTSKLKTKNKTKVKVKNRISVLNNLLEAERSQIIFNNEINLDVLEVKNAECSAM